MLSVETLITDIQNAFAELLQSCDSVRHRKVISETEALQLLTSVIAFQRKLEYYKECNSVFSGQPYFARTMSRFDHVVGYFTTEKVLHQTRSSYYEDTYQQREATYSGTVYYDSAEGVVHEAKELVERARHQSMSAVSRSITFIDDLLHQEVQSDLVELYGDLRLLAELTIFPIEEKLKIKGQLVDSGFKQVAEYLEIAEENYSLTPPHLKDTLSNCRNALESIITILSNCLGLKSTQKFSLDASALESNGFLDRETKAVVLSIWSYLSMKGSHSYSAVDKKSISDVDFGLEQTYRIIAQLLTKYENRNKNTTQP